ncbi:XTP/dITP diphosphatase [candidate division KSB1 bacterium]|nr:XTP/dITP diphosphatase [candidate division KSB1 bacterium]
MNNKIVLATGNQDKVKEIVEILKNLDIELLTLKDFPGVPEVVEDGKTLAENALKKARIISEFTKLPAVSDDTGLEVDALNGAPGVYSSRYSGENATYADNVKKLLGDLENVPPEKRQARFRCAVAYYSENKTQIVEGVCEGEITDQPHGNQGFGYDPVFFVPEYDCTFAEMDLNLKNKISHRAKAFLKLRNLLEKSELKF